MTLIHDSSGKGVGLENPLPTKVIESTIMQPVDIQSRYQQTIQTHNAVSVLASDVSASASWIDANGFDRLAITMVNDASTSSSFHILWSNDGVNTQGAEYDLVLNTATLKASEVTLKARYFKVQVKNADGALAHTMSAWAFLKA